MNLRLLPVVVGISTLLMMSARSQTLILEPSASVLEPGDAFSLKVSINTASLPIAGFSVYFNMAGTDASGSFTIQSETLSSEWSFLSAGPTLPATLPNTGNSQDYGNAATPSLSNHAADSSLWLFTLQVRPSMTTAPGIYTIQTTSDSMFFYDILGGGTEVFLPPTSIQVTVVPEPSSLLLALGSLGGMAFALGKRSQRRGRANLSTRGLVLP